MWWVGQSSAVLCHLMRRIWEYGRVADGGLSVRTGAKFASSHEFAISLLVKLQVNRYNEPLRREPLIGAIMRKRRTTYGQVAQMVEQRTENPRAEGSSPPLTTI